MCSPALLLRGIILPATLLVVCSPGLRACSCSAPPPPCQAFGRWPMIFRGTVTEALARSDGRLVRARMHVDKAYKGVSQEELVLFDDGMCDGPDLQVGEQYLMYTSPTESGEIPSRGCSRSRRIQYAEEDLQYLEARLESAPVARIFGQSSRREGDPYNSVPLPGTSIELRGPEKTLTTTVNDEGRYSFDNLSPGKYSIHATHPGFHMPSPGDESLSVAVEPFGCALVNLPFDEDLPGEIAGHLERADGSPAAAGIDLSLLQIDADGNSSIRLMHDVRTDEHGDYAFRHLPPGTYKIVLHICCFPTARRSLPANLLARRSHRG